MPDTLKLEIITPQATVFSEDVHMVTLPAIDGADGCLPSSRSTASRSSCRAK